MLHFIIGNLGSGRSRTPKLNVAFWVSSEVVVLPSRPRRKFGQMSFSTTAYVHGGPAIAGSVAPYGRRA